MGAPYLTVANVTYDCNLRCLFCTVGDRLNSASALPTDSFFDDASFGRSGGTLQISGGEPTLLKELASFCCKARNRFDEIILLTNGVNLASMATVDSFLNAGVSTFVIPLYASLENAFDSICGVSGSFKQVLNGLRNLTHLREEGRHFRFIVKILPFSFPDGEPGKIPTMLAANSIHPDEIVLSGIRAIGKMKSHLSFLPTADEISQAMDVIFRTTLSCGFDFGILELPLCLLSDASLMDYLLRCSLKSHQSGTTYLKYGESGSRTGSIKRCKFSCCTLCDLNWTCGGIPLGSPAEVKEDYGRNIRAIVFL